MAEIIFDSETVSLFFFAGFLSAKPFFFFSGRAFLFLLKKKKRAMVHPPGFEPGTRALSNLWPLSFWPSFFFLAEKEKGYGKLG